MTDHDVLKLAGCHPDLIARLEKVFAAIAALGFSMTVTDGVRTVEQQAACYAKGRTAPGPIVTQDDGVMHPSRHQLKPDGYGHAVDCCFVDEHGQPSWDARWPWKAYGAAAAALGLKWGGDWVSLHDLPHVELI